MGTFRAESEYELTATRDAKSIRGAVGCRHQSQGAFLSSLHLLSITFSLGYPLSQWKASAPPGEGLEPVFSVWMCLWSPKRGGISEKLSQLIVSAML